jgi:hypothetical protein
LVGFIVVALVARHQTSVDMPAAPTSTPPAVTTQLTVRVQPPEAKVTFDGIGLNGSPPSGGFPLDNAQHQIHVEAAGFMPRTEMLLLDSSRVTMDITLNHASTPAPSASTASTDDPSGQKPKYPAPWRPPVRQPHAVAPSSTEPPPSVAVAPPPPPPAPSSKATGPALDKSDPWSTPKP